MNNAAAIAISSKLIKAIGYMLEDGMTYAEAVAAMMPRTVAGPATWALVHKHFGVMV